LALADTANLVVQLRLDDKFSGGLGRINSQLSQLQAGAGQVGKGMGQIGTGLARVGTIAATGFAVGVGAAVKLAGDFEAQLNTINTIAKLSDSQLATLGEGIRKTFADTGQPLEDLTSAYYDLLSAGIKVSDAQSVLNTAVKLGIGGLGTTAESVNLLATAINTYGLDSAGAARAADIFAAAVRDGVVHVDDLAAGIGDVAPLAAQVGVTLEEIGAAYATLTARGVPAAEVGTQVNRAIIELLKPGPELVKVLDGLGETSFEASLKQKGLVQTLEDVRVEAEKQGIPFQDLFGRLEAYKFALATTGPNQAKFIAEQKAMASATGEVNAQFSERAQGLNFQLGKLKAAAQNAGITIGQALIPKLVPLVEKLSTFINENQGKIAEFGQKLADGLGAFADKIQTTDFSGIIDGLKLLGEVGKKVVDIFLSLPPGVQGALVAGLAINKLSGGLIGQGIGNVAGGLLKIAFARGATPALPLYVQQVGGGIGGPGAGAGKLGLLGILGGFAAALTADLVFGQIAAEINKRLNPTSFNYNEIAGQSGEFTRQQAAEEFAQKLATKLHLPLDEVKQRIVDAVNKQGLTFDQAVAALNKIDSNTKPGTVLGPPKPPYLSPGQTEGDRAIAQGFSNLNTSAFITALSRTTEIGLKDVGTTIENGIKTGLDPFGQGFLMLAQTAADPKDPPVLREISNHIIAAEELQKQYIASGDLNSAKQVQATIDGLHQLVGTVDTTNDYINALGDTAAADDRAMLNVTQQYAADQRAKSETTLAHLRGIQTATRATADKNFSPSFTANITNNVTAQLSVTQALYQQSLYTQIREG